MRDDATLVALAVQGDSEAFAELYERYFDRVFDFLARMVRNQAEAADLAQDTFIRAMNSLSTLASGASFKSWIFTIARNTALNRIERNSRLQPLQGRSDDDDEPTFDVVDTDRLGNPEQAAEAKDLAALVWEAAKGLDPNQYAVLDLTVRQELDSAEVADVLGVTKNNAYVMVNRMKKSLEDAVGALMLFKAGRTACRELDDTLATLQLGEMSPEARRLIDRHASRCDVCSEKKRNMASPFAIFGGFALVMPPAGAKANILEGLLGSFPHAGVPGAEASRAGPTGSASEPAGSGSEATTAGSEPTSTTLDGPGSSARTYDAGDGADTAASDAATSGLVDPAMLEPATHGPTASTAGPEGVAPVPSLPGDETPPPVSPIHAGAPDPEEDDKKHRKGLGRWLAGAAALLLLGFGSFLAVDALTGDAEEQPIAATAASPSTTPAATSTAVPTATPDPAAAPPEVPEPGLVPPVPGSTATPVSPGVSSPPTATPNTGGAPGGGAPGITQPECAPVLRSSVSSLQYGATASSLTFQLSGADCGSSVPYSFTADDNWVIAGPVGQIPAGGSIAITVRIDRRDIPGGGASNLHVHGPIGTLTLPVQVAAAPTIAPTSTPTRTPTPLGLTIRPTSTPAGGPVFIIPLTPTRTSTPTCLPNCAPP